MSDSQRTTITPPAARSGLPWLMIILSVWSGASSAGMATATAAITVAAPTVAAAATMDVDAALPEALSSGEWQSIRAAYEANRHAVQQSAEQPGSFRARNPGQKWLSAFNEDGVAISPDHGRWQFGLRLARWGHAGQEQQAASLVGIEAHGQRTVYRYSDGLEEWFVNDQRGLEHGFTVRQPPAGNSDSLRFALVIAGELTPRVAANGRDVALLDAQGNAALDYNDLHVWDADGRTLAAHFASNGKQLVLSVDASAARYPITIDPLLQQQAYLKASNTDGGDLFGNSVAIAGDTVVVGAPREDSNATGVNGNQSDNSATDSGSAYVFVRDGAGNWSQQAYLKASNTDGGDLFGDTVAIVGNTIVIGASLEGSNADGVNGNQGDNSASQAGAAYVFVRDGAGNWSQQAYLKASNSDGGDFFGNSVVIAGNIVVVGAVGEDSSATVVNGNQADNLAPFAGAVYVFVRTGVSTWSQQAYLKASNADDFDIFGVSVAISGDTVVVGAEREGSIATGVDGDQGDNSAGEAGAAYVFVRDGAGNWSQDAYLKASNTGGGDLFGKSVAIAGDSVVIGALREASNAVGVNGDQGNDSASQAGAAYVFVRNVAGDWAQQAYLKASNTDAGDLFGESVAVAGDIAVVGARAEDSSASGVNGDQTSNVAGSSGAAYVFVRDGTGAWNQQAYLKASNPNAGDEFGTSVAIAGDTVLVSARFEDSNATGVAGGQIDNSAAAAGAVYVFDLAFTVGGTVSGLAGSGLVLQNNGGDNLQIAANGAFTFATSLVNGSAYSVTVLAQPGGPSQTCTVANPSGTLMGANVSNVAITCTANLYTIGGNISGLNGNRLLLQNNAGGKLVVTANGPFTFPAALIDGSFYNVTATVLAQPGFPSQTCTVSNGSGTLAGANVTNVAVSCVSNQFTVGGTVTGMAGSGLVLRNNGGDDLPISANGSFTFATPLNDHSSYIVTVATQPTGPTRLCRTINNNGTLAGANVTNVIIDCDPVGIDIRPERLAFVAIAVGQSSPAQIVAIENTGEVDFAVQTITLAGVASTDFTLSMDTCSGEVLGPDEVCGFRVVFTPTTGGVRAAQILIDTDLTAQPFSVGVLGGVTDHFTVGGTVTGLSGSGLVLRNNGGDDLAISANGSFTFAAPLQDGSSYIVTVATQPTGPTRLCSAVNNNGTLAGANVTNVIIACEPVGIDIRPERLAFVTIAVGQSSPAQMVAIENTGEVDFAVQTITLAGVASTDFTLSMDTCSGEVLGPDESCGFKVVFTPTTGGVRAAQILIDTDLTAQPFSVGVLGGVTDHFTVGGTVTGLSGSGLVLRNNGGDDLAISANGPFTFAAPLVDGSSYIVTVATQPIAFARFCSVINGGGTLAGANVTNVTIDCESIGIDIMPERLNFDVIAVGQSSPAQIVIIENTGQVDFTVQMIALTGVASTDFALGIDTCSGEVLGPAEFCGFEVVFTPTTEGVRAAEIIIVTDLFAQPFRIDVLGGIGPLFRNGFENP